MRRVLALVVAVGLVLGAVAIRRAMDDDSSDPTVATSALTLLCAPEVADACAAVTKNVTIEQPGNTVNRLVEGKPLGANLWIAPDIWMDLVAERAPDSTALPKRSATLGTSSLVLVVNTKTADAAHAACPSGIDWACVATPLVAASLDFDEADSTAGLLTATAITSGLLDLPSFSANDFTDNDSFSDGLSNFEAALPNQGNGRTALKRLLTLGVPGATTALSADAASDPAVETKQLTILSPTPSLSVRIKAAGTSARVAELNTNALESTLQRDGWLAATASNDPTGLPNRGVMVALLDKWNTTIGR